MKKNNLNFKILKKNFSREKNIKKKKFSKKKKFQEFGLYQKKFVPINKKIYSINKSILKKIRS